MSARSRGRAKSGDAQLSLGLRTRDKEGVLERPGWIAAEAARLLGEIGYEVAVADRRRCRITIEAALRDWTVSFEERAGVLFARTYIMRAPEGDEARARVMETLLAANAKTPNVRFALDAGAVVLDSRVAAGQLPQKDELRSLVHDLVVTCNERYAQLLAVVVDRDFDLCDDAIVLRVA